MRKNIGKMVEVLLKVEALAEHTRHKCSGWVRRTRVTWSKKLHAYLKENIYLLFVDVFQNTLKLNGTRVSNNN